ncbi:MULTISPECIES: hypothetical protein [unclassified Streptomyces]|uniref:hypothetical protein n=1 Tax=unclassified Streptomyces TaxID=2593676 RepID=UPI00117F5129|nr:MULTISPECIES: hypothetical protein [unclassified Streptomyces]
MASLEANPGTVHLAHEAGYVSPGVALGESVKGIVRIDERGWVHVTQADGSRVSFPPHAVERVNWGEPAS